MRTTSGLPDTFMCRSGGSIETHPGDTGSMLGQSAIYDQVTTAIAAFGGNERINAHLREAWMTFNVFLGQRDALPARLEDIAATDLELFVSYCRETQAKVDPLLWTLSSLRILLAYAGHRADTLAVLTAQTTRVRINNGANHKYLRARQFATPAIGSRVVPEQHTLS
jgi:hypothetical protein